jgi:uncharacterized membrane protein
VPIIAIFAIGPSRQHRYGGGGAADQRSKPRRDAYRRGMVYALAYGVMVVVMAGLDFLWLSHTAGPVYHRHLGAVMAENPDMRAAIAFYLVYIFGILYFAVRPALAAGEWRLAMLNGALFGFFAYATYDLTNLATLKSWSLAVSLIDIAWGTLLTAIVSTAGTLAGMRFK